MASKVKVKKSLKFLKKSERKILSVSLKKEKPSFVQNLRICLENDYKDYLKPLPLRQSVFSFANNCTVFNEVSENLFNTLIDIFDSVKKGGSKYSKFQLKWYTFSGKCLDKTTDSAFDATLTQFEQTVIESVPGSSVKDFRLYMSCVLRLAIDCFQKIIIVCKKAKHEKTSVTTRVARSYDDTALQRIAGAMLRKMLRKRFSKKYYKNLTLNRQLLTKQESKLLRLMCLSKAEKQSEKLPVGFQMLDKGHLLVLKPRMLQFVRHFSILFRTNVNSQKYTSLGPQLFKVAKLVTTNSKTTRTMFFDSAHNVCGKTDIPEDAILNVYKEFTEKLFNTMANEHLKKVKFLSLTAAQVMLRDKLKVYASKTGPNQRSKP